MNFKKIISAILLIIIIMCFMYFTLKTSDAKIYKNTEKLTVVVTTFSSYDFARQIAGDNIELIFLLGPGIDSHSYEPSAQDMVTIQSADIFIYVGGTLEPWSETVVCDLPDTVATIRMIDCIELKEEVKIDGAVAEDDEDINEREYDEHIWSSPENAIEMVNYIQEEISKEDEENRTLYEENAKKYIDQIKYVQEEITELVSNSKRKRLVFGDKMPMQYFIDEFGLEVSAAFYGCSEETVPTSGTIAYLVDLIKKENIPVVLYIELSEGKVAKTLAEETGAKAMQIQTLHNISKEDFENGETYVSLMEKNITVLEKALN